MEKREMGRGLVESCRIAIREVTGIKSWTSGWRIWGTAKPTPAWGSDASPDR